MHLRSHMQFAKLLYERQQSGDSAWGPPKTALVRPQVLLLLLAVSAVPLPTGAAEFCPSGATQQCIATLVRPASVASRYLPLSSLQLLRC